MSKKEVIYQGLADLDVLIEDTSTTSPKYFKVVKVPAELTAGINTLKFKGNPLLFKDGSPIYIEILDSNGEPVYYETALDLESAEQAAIVSIYVNQDTPPGIGSIILCGTVTKSETGASLNTSGINVRWQLPMYIDPSKRNEDDIIFGALPTVSITSSTGSYTVYGYPTGQKYVTSSLNNITYRYTNNTPVLFTGSNALVGFDNTALSAIISIPYTSITNKQPSISGTVSNSLVYTSSIVGYSGSGIAYLADPIVFPITDSNSKYILSAADVTASIVYEQSASLAPQATENSYNLATAYFSNLQPQIGTVAKIRSYYRSTGVNEYIFSNETDISGQADEFGFTKNVVTASFTIATVHRNDKLDFKFEFVNPAGLVSKQVVEAVNNTFIGGNTYIGGDDNLLTGSLFVAGATGTGVHISGKNSAAMIRSIGYTGFQNAIATNGNAGFVLYSGSIQPLLSAAESYSGVGLELVANSSSYFRYKTANGGLLDVRTNSFFFGNTASYVSSSNGAISIYADNFSLNSQGHVTASSILVEKSVNATTQTMIDTNKSILDATNLGRTLYSNVTEYTIAASASVNNSANVDSFVFQGLQNEFKYIVSYQALINQTAGVGNPSLRLYATYSYANSGSSNTTNSYYDTWTQIAIDTKTFNKTGGVGQASATFSEDTAMMYDLGNAYQGKLIKVDLSLQLVPGASQTTGSIKNITVTGTRGIGASWNQPIGEINPTPPVD